MSTRIFIATDLGLLRAYREFKRRQDREPHLELIKEFKPESARKKLSDQVSDRAGRLPRPNTGGASSGDSANERQNRDDELERRVVKQLAQTIDELVTSEEVDDCRLAISAPIHKQLLDAIDHRTREKIGHVLASDLARAEPQELHERLSGGESRSSHGNSNGN